MAESPKFKIYSKDGEYVGALKEPEDCAAVVALRGEGCEVRYGHKKSNRLWKEGTEQQNAQESYDFFASTIFRRIQVR